MNQTVHPSKVNGSLSAPPSKSFAQRAILLASLAKGRSIVYNVGNNNDVKSAIDVCRALGAAINERNNFLEISGFEKPQSDFFNCGESGFLLRAFASVVATLDKEFVLTGEGSLLKRDQGYLEDSLRTFGVNCQNKNCKLPIIIKGPFQVSSATIDGAFGSQVLSGLLMAAPLTNKEFNLSVSNLKSKKYVDLTISIMNLFRVKVINKDYQYFGIASNQEYTACNIIVEADWSGAAFLLVAGAVAGRVELKNLNFDSFQPDKAIVDVLRKAGADIEIFDNQILASKNQLKPFVFDATNCPDLFPPLVALAANCKGKSTIKGVGRLANKESDRAKALVDIFGKMGIAIKVDGDIMSIKGGLINGCEVHSHNDHRIAMAAAVAALNATGPIIISGSEAVAKSYSEFFEHLDSIRVSQ